MPMNGPACVGWGNAIDQGPDSFQTGRAIAILMAITGNLDVPGGEIESERSGFRWCDHESGKIRIHGRWSDELELRHRLTQDERKRKISAGLLTDFRYDTPRDFVTAVLEGKPYPIRAAFVQASNPLSSWSDIHKTFEAFNRLDFVAVSEMFMTPTAALADIVFPVASFLEYDGVRVPGGPAVFQRKVAQVGQCRSDLEILNGLAGALGLGEFFWETAEAFWDYVLLPVGATFEELRKKGVLQKKKPRFYKKYNERGFFTPSGKVELYSKTLETMGFTPLPVYREQYLSDDERRTGDGYDLLCTCKKVNTYMHSAGRQINGLRKKHPDPLVIIHPVTARERGICEGDWVTIASRKGAIRQKAHLSDAVNRRVLVAEHAWWFPEEGYGALFGYDKSNYNALISNEAPCSPEVGSFITRGIACTISREPL